MEDTDKIRQLLHRLEDVHEHLKQGRALSDGDKAALLDIRDEARKVIDLIDDAELD